MKFTANKLANACAVASLLALTPLISVSAANEVVNQTPSRTHTFTLITGEKAIGHVNNQGRIASARLQGKDGEEVFTHIFRLDNATYLIPASAQPYIDEGKLDIELFNLDALLLSGSNDESSAMIPLIIKHKSQQMVLPRSVSKVKHFKRIKSTAFSIKKSTSKQLLETLLNDDSIEKIWLDRPITSHKAYSSSPAFKGSFTTPPATTFSVGNGLELGSATVPLTGAVSAYEQGLSGAGVTVAVLDSGYDFEHADLSGKVEEFISYPYNDTGDDLDGHGTHVASTIAGNGFESNGLFTGMAPQANLIVAKVLDNNGSGSSSDILDGMIWAVENGADVINMSLGASGGTSCSGPLVDMVETLSEQSLFVIAAGNDARRQTVSTPGCSPKALTVGAVDRNNQTAIFSSKGPSVDGQTAKPDIASQGVNVIAAASGGLNETAYRTLSGTSMATPHVSGGAALLLEQNPTLTPSQLKALLTSSVSPTTAPVLEQGAGPMNIENAVSQQIIGTANQSLGVYEYPQSKDKITQYITLENISEEDIELSLSLKLTGDNGKDRISANLAKLKDKKITIAAHSKASVPIIIKPDAHLKSGAYGTITGRLIATQKKHPHKSKHNHKSTAAVIPVYMYLQGPQAVVTISATDRFGNPATSPSSFAVLNSEDETVARYTYSENGSTELTLPEGEYTFVSHITTRDDATNQGLVNSIAMMTQNHVKIKSDTQISFDAARAEKVNFLADEILNTLGYSVGFSYSLTANNSASTSATELAPQYVNDLYLSTQGRPDDRLHVFATTRAVAPDSILTTQDGQILNYTPIANAPMFNGIDSETVTFVASANEQEIEQANLTGKIALIADSAGSASSVIRRLENAGAVGAIFYYPGSVGRFNLNGIGASIPAIVLDSDSGDALKAAIESGKGKLHYSGIAREYSPYAYSLAIAMDGQARGGDYYFAKNDLASVPTSYYSQDDTRFYWTDVFSQAKGASMNYSTGSSQIVAAPLTRIEHFSSGEAAAWTNTASPLNANSGALYDGPFYFHAGEKQPTSFFKAPVGATLYTNGTPILNRVTNRLALHLPAFGDASGHDGTNSNSARDTRSYSLVIDGQKQALIAGAYTMPADYTRATLTNTWARTFPHSTIKQQVGFCYETQWQFDTSAHHQGPQDIIVPRINIPLDLGNTAKAGQSIEIELDGVKDHGDVNLSDVTLSYAYGDEQMRFYTAEHCLAGGLGVTLTWHESEVYQRDGKWFARIPNDAQPGQFVHLNVAMSGNNDATVQQKTVRAYKLR